MVPLAARKGRAFFPMTGVLIAPELGLFSGVDSPPASRARTPAPTRVVFRGAPGQTGLAGAGAGRGLRVCRDTCSFWCCSKRYSDEGTYGKWEREREGIDFLFFRLFFFTHSYSLDSSVMIAHHVLADLFFTVEEELALRDREHLLIMKIG